MNILQASGERFREKAKEVAEFYNSKKSGEADRPYKMTADEVETGQKMNLELKDLKAQFHAAEAEEGAQNELKALNQTGESAAQFDRTQVRGQKSLGELVAAHENLKNLNPRSKTGGVTIELEDYRVKTLVSESGTGFTPPNYRSDIVILSAQRQPKIMSLIPIDETDNSVIKYMQESTATNNAAARLEGASLSESALGYTEITSNVQNIDTSIPVTDQQLEDVPQIMGLINNRLNLFLIQKAEKDILSGNGASPTLQGIIGTTGVQTQAVGALPLLDAILNAFTKVQISGGSGTDTYASAEVTALVMNPLDYQAIALTRTQDGIYVLGNPSSNAILPLWGQVPTLSTAIAQGTAVAGDFQGFLHISLRKGVTIEVGYVNDDFKKGQKTIRATMRLSLENYRPGAFCTVTGLHA